MPRRGRGTVWSTLSRRGMARARVLCPMFHPHSHPHTARGPLFQSRNGCFSQLPCRLQNKRLSKRGGRQCCGSRGSAGATHCGSESHRVALPNNCHKTRQLSIFLAHVYTSWGVWCRWCEAWRYKEKTVYMRYLKHPFFPFFPGRDSVCVFCGCVGSVALCWFCRSMLVLCWFCRSVCALCCLCMCCSCALCSVPVPVSLALSAFLTFRSFSAARLCRFASVALSHIIAQTTCTAAFSGESRHGA